MSTIILECGCSISYWMGVTGEARVLAGFHLCDKHLQEYKETIKTIFTEIVNQKAEA